MCFGGVKYGDENSQALFLSVCLSLPLLPALSSSLSSSLTLSVFLLLTTDQAKDWVSLSSLAAASYGEGDNDQGENTKRETERLRDVL